MTPEEARRLMVEHGASIKDRVIAALTPTYYAVVEQVRSIARTYRSDMDSLRSGLANLRGLEPLVTYFAVVAILNKHRPLSHEQLRALAEGYEREVGDEFSAARLRRALSAVDGESADAVVSDLIRFLSRVRGRHGPLYLWILRQRRVAQFEEEVRRYMFGGEGGNRASRGVKTFLRLFIHETNVPLAPYIVYRGEWRKYDIYVDVYTATITLRSGAFEDLPSTGAERVKARLARRILCEARGRTCDDVVVRLESVRGLVRLAARRSGDPLLYERGAFDMALRCCGGGEGCPASGICSKYPFIKVK